LAGWAPRWGGIEKLGAFRTIRLPTFTNISEMTKTITDSQTEILYTLPSFAKALCKEVKSNGRKGLNLQVVITAGEMLDDYTRKTCKDVLGAKVFDGYGTNELGFIAAECEHHSGLHVENDACVVEITRDGQRVSPGEEGDITVTNLVNTAFPLIRYNIEDIGKLEADKCPCGSSFPLMRITQGRKSDTFLRSDGAVVPAVIIKNCLETIDGVVQAQVIQEKANKFVVNVEKDPTYMKDPAEEIKSKLTKVVGPAEIGVIFQSEIPRDHGRKLRYFVSKLT